MNKSIPQYAGLNLIFLLIAIIMRVNCLVQEIVDACPDVVDGVVLDYLQHFSTRLVSEQYLQTIWPLSINQ